VTGPTPADYRRLADFRYRIRRFLGFSDQVARAAGLEPQQHQLLLAAKGIPAGQKPTIGALAERMQLRHHSTVELLNRLEERGLVRRVRDQADRRCVLIEVTAAGEAVLHDLAVLHLDELRTAGPLFVEALDAILRGEGLPAERRGAGYTEQHTAGTDGPHGDGAPDQRPVAAD
jgi:DNA-binding MarR family transcriptional regulator